MKPFLIKLLAYCTKIYIKDVDKFKSISARTIHNNNKLATHFKSGADLGGEGPGSPGPLYRNLKKILGILKSNELRKIVT